MSDNSIKIYGYSVGDSSVGIGSAEFTIDTGLVELNDDDREFLKGVIRDIWELHDNGDVWYWFSDDSEEDRHKFGYKDSEEMLEAEE